MNLDTPRSTSQDVDLEAQMTESTNHVRKPQTQSFKTAGSRHSVPRSNFPEHTEEHPNATPPADGVRDQGITEIPNTIPHVGIPSSPHGALPTDTPAIPEWKSWKADEPLITKIPGFKTTKQDWVKAMEASDDGMCKGWNNSIDTLIIFAGLFSATVTAFTVESYQWLNETPADTLARLQLRDLLNATQNPAIDRLAPATFNITSASVAINTLWFASLTLSLGVVVISILCKQWLYEYQRYDNFTLDEAFLIRGLRHRGLQTWKVPEIISSLSTLLQIALILFLAGILVLLWPLQPIVVSITTTIVGLTFLFLITTTALPSLQYIFPMISAQCPYKSSQSWSFFRISAFWLFDFEEFTSWATIDRWEVTQVYSGTGHTLARAYKLLGNSVDAVLSIYTVLADTSLKPTTWSDLALLSDFVDGLDTSQSQNTKYSPSSPGWFDKIMKTSSRISRLGYYHPHLHVIDKRTPNHNSRISWPFNNVPRKDIDDAYFSSAQQMLSIILERKDYNSNSALTNRYIEHWARSLDIQDESTETIQYKARLIWNIYDKDDAYDPDIAVFLVELFAHLFKTDQFDELDTRPLIGWVYPKLMELSHQHNFNPSPATLLKDIQDWVNRVPESDISKKASYTRNLLLYLGIGGELLSRLTESHKSDSEQQHLASFMRFFVDLYEGEDPLQPPQQIFERDCIKEVLVFFRKYLVQHPDIS